MTESRKLAIVVGALLVFAAVTFVFHKLRERVNVWLALLIVSLIVLVMALSIHPLRAHDHARPALDNWYSGLKSKHGGPCCDGPNVDAKYLSDTEWESKDGRYRVFIEGQWIDVPDDAVLKEPNRDGRTLVWPTWRDGRRTVRCFIPGVMM